MERYHRIGNSDLKVSLIGLGAWQAGFRVWGSGYTREDLINAYRYAFDNGVNFIDTAEVYGYGVSEEIVGEAVKGYPEVVVATKIAGYRVSEEDIMKSVERSIRRLRRSEIDLYQLHWPPPFYVNICKVINRLEKTIDKGYVRYIGVSNFTYKLLKKALECTRRYEIVSNQVHYNMVYRVYEKDLIPYMEKNKISLIAYSPLGKGSLGGKRIATSTAQRTSLAFRRGAGDNELQNTLDKLSEKYNVSKAAIALRWIIEKDGLPIPGVKNIRHVKSILETLNTKIKKEDIELLDKLTYKYREGADMFNYVRYIPASLQKFFTWIEKGL